MASMLGSFIRRIVSQIQIGDDRFELRPCVSPWPDARKLAITPEALNWDSMRDANSAPPIKTISLLGIPFDANSSYLRGPAQAPQAIREELHSGSSNLWTEDGIDLGRPGSFHDAGDVVMPDDAEAAFPAIESAVDQTLKLGHPLICLSGDHSVTYPTIKAFTRIIRI